MWLISIMAPLQERYLTERYDQLMQTWIKKVERYENSAKRRFVKSQQEVKKKEFDLSSSHWSTGKLGAVSQKNLKFYGILSMEKMMVTKVITGSELKSILKSFAETGPDLKNRRVCLPRWCKVEFSLLPGLRFDLKTGTRFKSGEKLKF